MATADRIAMRTNKQIVQILKAIEKLTVEIGELKLEITDPKPKKRGRKPAISISPDSSN